MTSSIHLPSIFQHNKRETSSLSKRSTISAAPLSNSQYGDNTLQRISTLSKVKRFGSLLVRNKKNSTDNTTRTTRADNIFPAKIDTTLASSYSLSASSTTTNTSSSDEDEEHLKTPTTVTTSPTHIAFKNEEAMFHVVSPPIIAVNKQINDRPDHNMMVRPQDQSNSVPHANDIIPAEVKQDEIHAKEISTCLANQPDLSALRLEDDASKLIEEIEEQEVDPSKLSMVALVRYHLNMALKEADLEIESELESCRTRMLQSLQLSPTLSY